MRQVLRELAVTGLVLAGGAMPASAQRGSIQVTGSAHALTGDSGRIGDQARFEPDGSVSWFQPGWRAGILQLEMRGTKRGREPHLGKTFVAWRDVKLGGAAWTFEAGDLYFTPVIGDYKFTNLATPAITFAGGAFSVRGSRSNAGVVVGRVTAWRNIFGTDADTLGQDVALARAALQPLDWLEVNARASRIRTTDVREFSFTIAASDQAAAGTRVTAGPLQVVADGGIVSYRRAGSTEQIRDASLMAGLSLLLPRGWVQVNGSRFSPGEFPLLNYPLIDRQTAFAAGEYDIGTHVRVFGGWERFRYNLDPARAAAGLFAQTESTGDRGFGGIRLHIAGRSSLAFRVEEGDRRSSRLGDPGPVVNDTGVLSAELQSRLGPLTGFLRLSRRQHEATDGVGSFTQDDGAAQLFASLSRRVQVFGTVTTTRTRAGAGTGSTFYQFGGGAQVQVPNRSLWFRVEGLAARNVDLFTQNLVARNSLDLGVNGQVARNTTVGLNLHADRLPPGSTELRPWVTRSILRVTRSFPTGSVRISATPAAAAAAARPRGTGSIAGMVFEDWDADGVADEGERALEGIPVLLGTTGSAVSSARGEFAFINVPAGLQRVGLDVSALPVDFDAPAVTSVQIELPRGDTRRVVFGLVPLGTVGGRVMRDTNANGQLDAADEPMDGGVLVLDAGARSEQTRKGRFRFDAVRSGSHTVDLLPESLPDGATIVGARSVAVAITKAQPSAAIDFLVKVEKRPEIRRVFPARGGAGAPAPAALRAPTGRGSAVPPDLPPTQAPRAVASARAPALPFTLQIAALGDAGRARRFVAELRKAGFPAYLVGPAAGDCLYRIRVGHYATRAAVEKVRAQLENRLGERLWVIRER